MATRRRRTYKTLTIKNQSGKHLMSYQAGSWKTLAKWYGNLMKDNKHLTTRAVVTRPGGNHAIITVGRA
jgi:hypothetical protein